MTAVELVDWSKENLPDDEDELIEEIAGFIRVYLDRVNKAPSRGKLRTRCLESSLENAVKNLARMLDLCVFEASGEDIVEWFTKGQTAVIMECAFGTQAECEQVCAEVAEAAERIWRELLPYLRDHPLQSCEPEVH
jgi:hypothetical protein